jgi:hypothetical protein
MITGTVRLILELARHFSSAFIPKEQSIRGWAWIVPKGMLQSITQLNSLWPLTLR